jgi:outer membrane protein OmpA-like peptidoglycan-associated protein
VVIPELFSPDPDVVNDVMTIAITVNHPVPIKEWTIQIQPNRQSTGQAGQQQSEGTSRQPGGQAGQQQGEGAGRQPGGQTGQIRNRGPFFEQKGTGSPPAEWKWNGKSSRPSGEMVQSATDYRLTLTVIDNLDKSLTKDGIISVDVIVRRDGDVLRIVVPSIVFPPNSADFKLLSEDDMRSNRRILNLIGRALNRFPDYRITVEGHSNPTTPAGAQRDREETNELKPLSQKRAQAVIDYLSANDCQFRIDKVRLTAVGIGGTRTVADYDDSDENWKNRRVEFILRK